MRGAFAKEKRPAADPAPGAIRSQQTTCHAGDRASKTRVDALATRASIFFLKWIAGQPRQWRIIPTLYRSGIVKVGNYASLSAKSCITLV
jgi:hypothetical protein